MSTVRERDGRLTARSAATLGLLAHDAKKQELCDFAAANRHLLDYMRLIAPEDTARALADVGVETLALAPDTHGGDLQLAAAVVDGTIDAVIFLHDPLSALTAEPSVAPLLKVCDIERVPIATNIAAAEIVVLHVRDRRVVRSGRHNQGHPAGKKRGTVLRLVPYAGTEGHG